MSLWLLPVPCADSNLQIHRLLEQPADPRQKACQEGRMQRLEGGLWVCEWWRAGAEQVDGNWLVCGKMRTVEMSRHNWGACGKLVEGV